MDSLDISHWPCDLVMQSPLIPTYDECRSERRGHLKPRYEGSCKGACALCFATALAKIPDPQPSRRKGTCEIMSEAALHCLNEGDAGAGSRGRVEMNMSPYCKPRDSH